MEANYVHKDSTTLVQDKLVKNELNQIELQYNTLKQQNFNELLKENQELKKQLEDKTEDYKRMKDNFDSKVDVLTKIATQQKEFINYLEDECTKIQSEIEKETNNNAKYFKIERRQTITGILQKYKEIIGVEDEKEN